MTRSALLVLSSFFVASACVFAEAPSITALGTLDPDAPGSRALGVSGDGSIVVGETNVPGVNVRAFLWTEADGMTNLGTIGGVAGNSRAFDVSDGGSAVGESAGPAGSTRPFLRKGTTMLDLGALSGSDPGTALAVSANGRTIVGESGGRAFLFSDDEMIDLGEAPGADSTEAKAVSDDGSVVVGDGIKFGVPFFAFRWTSATGLQLLEPTAHATSAAGISGDGVFIGGSLRLIGASPRVPTIRTEAAGTTPLTSLTNNDAVEDVSANGRIAIGNSDPLSTPNAIIWHDGEPTELLDLLADQGADVSEWSELAAEAVSENGRVVVGFGTFAPLNCRMAFRAELTSHPPTVEIPQARVVECEGETTTVAFSSLIEDVDSATVLVAWSVNGELRKSEVIPTGSIATFETEFEDGESEVVLAVLDEDNTIINETTVTVIDTTDPIVIVAPTVKLKVDRRKAFASRNRIPLPDVTDVCDVEPELVNDAPARLDVGTTRVRWTVTDESGNKATASQKVKVVNDRPKAKAGRDVRAATSSSTAKVNLDGGDSSDPNDHRIRFRWSAPGVSIQNADRANASGRFPVGTTTVKLTVTDQLGAKDTDTVRVIVRRNGPADSETTDALASARREAFRAATDWPEDPATLDGFRFASDAFAIDGVACATDDSLERSLLRYSQAIRACAAGETFAKAYVEGGSAESLSAAELSLDAAYRSLKLIDR